MGFLGCSMGAWGWMECKAGHGSVSGYRGMLVDARGRCALGWGGEGIQRDARGCRWMLVAAGGYIIHLLQLFCQCVQSWIYIYEDYVCTCVVSSMTDELGVWKLSGCNLNVRKLSVHGWMSDKLSVHGWMSDKLSVHGWMSDKLIVHGWMSVKLSVHGWMADKLSVRKVIVLELNVHLPFNAICSFSM